MSVARALWSQTFAPGKAELARIDCDIKLSLVVLDETLANQERSSIKIIQRDPDDGETITFVLANLIPGKIEAQTIDLIISEGEDIEVEVTGKNTVHISGNYIIQKDDDDDDELQYDSDEEGSIDEEAFHLQDVSSDVEIDPAEIMDEDSENDEDSGRFEEVEEKENVKVDASPKASGKRPAEASPAQGNAQKKQKKDKGGENKPAPAAAAAKPEAKPAAPANANTSANNANGKPAGGQGGGEGKKHKKNKNKDKQKNA